MRLPRPRLTLKRMMGVIVLAAIACVIVPYVDRSIEYRQRARMYRGKEWKETQVFEEARARRNIDKYDRITGRRAAHYASLAIKYERAAWRPWLDVAPDPEIPGVSYP